MKNDDIFGQIRSKFNTLSASQKEIGQFVLKHPEQVMISSLNDLALACQVSEATVMRFLNKIGHTSYQVFRVNIAQSISQKSTTAFYDEVGTSDSTEEIVDKLLHTTSQAIVDSGQLIVAEHIDRFTQAILSAASITIIGVGSSAAQAFDFSHKLIKLGIRSSYYNDSHMINIQCAGLRRDDLLIAFSHSGESREILDGVHFAKKQGCPVLSVTSYRNSSLAAASDTFILSSSQETKYRSDAMTSRIIQMVIIDIIYVRLALSLKEDGIDAINRSRLAVAQNKT